LIIYQEEPDFYGAGVGLPHPYNDKHKISRFIQIHLMVAFWSPEALLLPRPEHVEGGANRACARQNEMIGREFMVGNYALVLRENRCQQLRIRLTCTSN